MTLAVADTEPIIHLDEIDALHLLSTIDHVLLPQTVCDELAAGTVPPALGAIEYELVEADAAALDVELDAGETAALAVAAERSAVFLTDDLAARNAATERGVEVHGSIGILVLAYSRGALSESAAIGHMRALQAETSLFITDAIVEQGIALLAESS
ncbi:nucleic acid-binding protein [Natrinema sp. CBA1119]|uniref:nucleic acid-binding protein n=1 Tax=Natrinema sp. CBA1119 TaxID=1608465 RepID=UPI000BF9D6EC|nr:nucleic acid-binding protein [Natrinema sp. CBA1119]